MRHIAHGRQDLLTTQGVGLLISFNALTYNDGPARLLPSDRP